MSSLLEMYPNINAAFLNSKFVEFNGNLEKVTDYIKLHNFSQVLNGQKEHKYEKENSEEEFEPASDESYLNSSLQQDLLSFGAKSIVKKTNGKNDDPMDADNDQPLEKGPGGKKGNAVSNARIYIMDEKGFLEEIKRIEVHESTIIGDGSIKDFLVANDLLALEPLFRIFFNINIYQILLSSFLVQIFGMHVFYMFFQ